MARRYHQRNSFQWLLPPHLPCKVPRRVTCSVTRHNCMGNASTTTFELTFDLENANIVAARFRKNDFFVARRKLVLQPPRTRAFRALCILLLLAKYKGPAFSQ